MSFELGEREKELKCQNQITKLLNSKRLSPQKIFQKIVNFLPPAFQYPEKACARLIIGVEKFITDGFEETEANLSKELESGGKIIGKLEVCYHIKKGETTKDLFLKEEEELINLIAQRIVTYYENNNKEQLLIKKEVFLKKLVENLNEILYEISVEGIINYVSKDTMGYKPEELIGRNFLSFIHTDDLNRVKEIHSNLSTRDSKPVEYRFINKKGEARWVRTSTRPLFEKGKLVGGSGTMFDITENKFIEDNLNASEQLHRSIFQASPDVITVTDLQGKIISSSPRTVKIFGYKKQEDFTGHSLFEFIHKDFHEKAKHEIDKMFKGNFKDSEEYLAIKQDGTTFFIEVSGQIIRDEKGNPKQMIFIIRNIDQRKELEKQLISTKELFKTLVESINEGIYEISVDGTINYVSPAIERILGFKPEELIGKNFFQYMYPEDRPALITALKELGNKDYSYLEYRYFTKDGKVRWVSSSTNPISQNGVVIGGRGALSDIHEKKMIELKLKESELQNSEIIKSSPVGKILYIENGTVLLLNKKFTEITGYTIEDIATVDKWFCEVYPDEKYRESIIKKWDEEIQNFLRGNASFNPVEGCIKCKDGSSKWIETSYAKIGNLNLVTFLDINSKKTNEQMLRQSEESLRNLVNSQTNYVLKTNIVGKHTYWNRKFQEEFGWVYEGVGMANGDALSSICPHHHQRTIETVEKCIAKPGEIFKVEIDKPTKDGGVRTTLWEFICLTDENNNPSEIQCMGIDITEIREARDKLKESEKKYRDLFDTMPNGYYRSTPEGYFVDANPAYIKMLGYESLEELKKLYIPEDIYVQSTERDIITQENPEYVDEFEVYRLKKKTGDIVWIEDNARYIKDEKGDIIYFEGICRDVTDKKNAEEKLRKSEENYRNLFYNSPEGYLLIKDGIYLDCNKASEKIIAGDRLSIIGKTPAMISPEYQPNGKLSSDYAKELIEETLIKGSNSFEWIHKKYGGAEFIARINLSVIEQFGEKIIFTTWQDITEKKKDEENLRKLSQAVEQSPVSIVITNLNGSIEYANSAACKTTGYALDELKGQNPRVLKSGETTPKEYEELWNKISSGKQWKGIFHNRRKNGEYYWESSIISPIIDSNGKITHYLAVKEDITAKKAAEQELIKFMTIADKANYGIAIAELDGLLTYSNDAFAHMHGYEVNEIVGKNLAMLHSEEQLVRVFKTLELLKKHGEFSAEEVWRTKKDGTVFPSLMNAKVMIDDNGEPQFMWATTIDISSLKESEEALARSENKLNYAQEIAQMGSWDLNLSTNKLTWSKNYYKLVEIDEKIEPNQELFSSLIHPDDYKLFEEYKTKLYTTKKPVSFDMRLVLSDGRVKWVRNNIVPQFKNDVLISLSGVNIDITLRKEIENTLLEREEQLNHAQEIAQMGSWEFNVITGDVSWSKNYYKMLDHDINKPPIPFPDIKKMVHPDDSELFENALKKIEKSKSIESFQFRMIFDDKKAKWIHVYMHPVYNENRLVSIKGVSIDITEQKESELEIKKLSMAIEQSPIAIVITDLEAKINYVSPAFYKMTGYTSEEVIGRNTNILKSGKTPKQIYADLWDTIVKGETWYGEWINKRKTGEFYWESVSVSPIMDRNNKIINYLAVKEDITQRKEAQEEILELNLNLEKKVEERTKQLAGANEELSKKTNELETFFSVALDLLCIAD